MSKKLKENPTSLDFVSLQVRDISLSKKFYHDNLGFRVEDETRPDAVVFSTGMGAIFAIRKPLVDLNQVSQVGFGIGLWFYLPDVKDIFENAKETGIRIIQPPTMGPFGEMLILADPDGYVITLHTKQ
ncbi:VOC family protein [Methanosphaerula palustris]|uniref:Glyoxalase/bleomycin resistance protein/dioxygenase n=1 Tax=Methanosphaerula palustris (strain ATCC BAA-1556 / DSM 19958 / E1-9c) TaxID=521011 RepID=B8GHJ1_METPE|nr:VOC family protein [Methanosphaerula palustris]ACL16596.1 Glyoxalase/bleomycin resistance protein/dioxygenase [Methanosphaerula palustris E1-9c]